MSGAMPEPAVPSPLPPRQFARSWRLVTVAGALGASYYTICIASAPRVKFLTSLGATAFDFGLMATLGSVALIFQVASGYLCSRVRSRKRAWFGVVLTHRMMFAGVLAAPFFFTSDAARIVWIVAIQFLHDSLANLGTPMWFSWMSDIVPGEALNRHWASRQRFTTGAAIAASVLLAMVFDWFEAAGHAVGGFVILGAIGTLMGVVDILLFIPVPEPPWQVPSGDESAEPPPGLFQALLQPVRDPQFRPFLVFSSYYYFAALVAWPFFALYMVDFLKVGARDVQLMLAAQPLGVVLSTRFWGLLCDTYGQRPVLQLALLGKAVFPLAFIVAPMHQGAAIAILTLALFLDGLIDAGMLLAMQGMLLKHTPRRSRSMYLAAFNFLSLGLAAGSAPLLAGWMIDAMKGMTWSVGVYVFGGFHVAFLISLLMRFGAYWLTPRLHDPQGVPLATMLRHLKGVNLPRATRELWRLNMAEEGEERVLAAHRLGRLHSPLAIRDLIRALRDADLAVRDAAAGALAMIGTAEASQPLAAALLDTVPGVRSRAARILGEIGDGASLRALLQGLGELDEEVLGEVVDSLAKIGDWAAILPLMCLFDRVQSPPLREKIAAALGRLSEIQSTDEVMELLSQGRSSNTRQ
jgi:MFS family permease